MRILRPSLAVICVALLASLCIHLPVYEALGALANVLLHAPPKRKPSVVEFEMAPLADEPEAQKPEPAVPPPKPAHAKPPEPKQEKRQPERELAKKEEKHELTPKQPIEAQAVPVEPLPTPTDRPLAVKQKSDNPDVEKPENARYIAEENRKVEEETVAKLRNMQRDDEQPQPTATPTKSEEEQGNADKTVVEDMQNVTGNTSRAPDPREAAQKHEQPSQESAGKREAEAMPRPATEPSPSPSKEVAGARASGSPDTGGEAQTILVQDGAGTFRIRKAPDGRGVGEAGNPQRPGKPTQSREDREGSHAVAGSNVNLRLSWSQFEDTFGADELREQREAYLAQRKSSSEGHSRQREWREFRAAIENFVPNVRPGDQTALNAAADPFANYLSDVHRRIHRTFADEFLQSLPLAGGPFGDYSLHTELEIVINGDGTLQQVGIAETSGFLPFDYGAYNAVMKAGPYPVPPRKILSGDGRVYFHWGFYRNERACGTFNARPYILPHPPGTPKPGKSPLRDPEEHHTPPTAPAARPGEGELGMQSAPREPAIAHAGP